MSFLATIRLQRAVTELAYLRDAMTRGLVDQTGVVREKALLAKIRAVRGQAVISPEGRAPYPSFRRQPVDAPRVRPAELPRTGRAGWQLPRADRVPGSDQRSGRGAVGGQRAAGADCYPVLRGRPQLETAGGVEHRSPRGPESLRSHGPQASRPGPATAEREV